MVELAAGQTDAFQAVAVLLGKHVGDAHEVVEIAGVSVVLKGLQGEVDVRADEKGGLVE